MWRANGRSIHTTFGQTSRLAMTLMVLAALRASKRAANVEEDRPGDGRGVDHRSVVAPHVPV
jgi:hypothetical protein